jgi:hypothetical protein
MKMSVKTASYFRILCISRLLKKIRVAGGVIYSIGGFNTSVDYNMLQQVEIR